MSEFTEWLTDAEPGAQFIYYKGFLAVDQFIVFHNEGSAPTVLVKPEVANMAREVWRAYEEGKVLLLQRRHGPNCFDYIAYKSQED